VSIIEVPVDALEYCGYEPFAQNAKAFITSRFETVFGLKNKNRELEMFYGRNRIKKWKKKIIIYQKGCLRMEKVNSMKTETVTNRKIWINVLLG
jgi:hypothetical protein